MRRLRPYLPYLLILIFAGWCYAQFREDIAQLSAWPLLRHPLPVVVAALLSLFNYGIRVLRWRAYLAHLGHALSPRFATLTFVAGFAFTLSPGKVGELVRARYYRGHGVPVSDVAAAFFMERLMDLLSMLALALFALAAADRQGWILWTAPPVIGLVLVLLGTLPWRRLERRWVAHRLTPPWARRGGAALCRTLDSARALLGRGLLTWGFLAGLLAWGAEGLGLYVLGGLVPEPALEMGAALGIYSVAIIIGALSFLPGGLGGTEAVMVALLAAHGFSTTDAIFLTLVCRLLTLWLAVALGWICVGLLRGGAEAASRSSATSSASGQEPVMNQKPLPLCVDLDGTLIHGDVLLESFLLLVRRCPGCLFRIPFWLLRGKAVLKAEIARRVEIDVASLPYHRELLTWLAARRSEGAPLWLCTASNEKPARAVAEHLGIFDGVLASDPTHNLSGPNKAARLAARFGEHGYLYCGDHLKDLPVWRRSGGAVVVNGGPALESRVAALARVVRVFPPPGNRWRAALRALRPHQWAKNVLVFLPLLAAHRLADAGAVLAALQAFLAFGLCASSVYLLNDMLDLEADRQHPRKCNRPFASGRISLLFGFIAMPLLLLAALGLAWRLPDPFLLFLTGYYLLTLAYSFRLKQVLMLDTITLAALYTFRIVAGAAAIPVTLSFWMLLFSVFLFLSLALVKRYAELDGMRRRHRLQAAGRGYQVGDLPVLQGFGTASAYMSVLVLALYINSPEVAVLYSEPRIIWFLCVLTLYWTSRMWMKAHRGEMHDDPVVFALRDRISLWLGALAALTVALASWS